MEKKEEEGRIETKGKRGKIDYRIPIQRIDGFL